MTAGEGRGEQFAALDLVARLGEVAVPTLVVHGEHDAVLPVGNGRALADGIPGARLVTLDAGHAVTIECAEDVAASVHAHVLVHP
jgi:pimeloyl-ACP methyl ester carboxylesterase